MGLVTTAAEHLGRQETVRAGRSVQANQSGADFSASLKNAVGKAAGSLEDIFAEASAISGVPSDLLKAVAKAESNFNARAVSKAGAMGIMQLMPGTARSLGVTDPFDARQNILGGARYLKENLERFGGNVSLALAAYNAGPGNVEKYGGIPPFKETQNYVKKIMADLGSGISIDLSDREVPQGGMYLADLYGSSGFGLGSILGMDGMGDSLMREGIWPMFLASLDGYSQADGEGTVTLDKDAYVSLVEMLRLQMMSRGIDAGDTLI